MRRYNGTDATTSNAHSYLSGAAGPFTIWFWYQPTAVNVGGTAKTLIRTGGASNGWWFDHINDTVRFGAVGYSGTDPAITIPWPDSSRPHFVCVRKSAAGASPWHVFLDDVIGTISGSIDFTLGTPTDQRLHVGSNAGVSSWASGDIGEVAIWGVRLTSEMVYEGAAGVAADQFPAGLLGYWPLRGNSSPEPDYSGHDRPLTVTNATAAPHIEIVPSIWPAAPKTAYEPAWLLDIDHPIAGEIRRSTRDLYDDIDADVLGAPYPAGIEGDPAITVQLPQNAGIPGGVVEPDNTSVTVQNADGAFDRSLEWRRVKIRMRLYDRVSHALKRTALAGAFEGMITDRDFDLDAVTFQCSAVDPVLDTPVPRVTIELNASITKGEDGALRPIDLGAPIPVACGEGGYCAAPYIEHDMGESPHPGGQRYVLSWGGGVGVIRAFFEDNADKPGLEAATFFSPIASATYRAANKFRVPGVGAVGRFEIGWLIAYSPDSGTTWLFSRVDDVETVGSNADVTLTDSILTGSVADPLPDLQIADDFEIEDGVWEYDNGSVVTDLTTALDPGEGNGSPIFQLTTPLRANPAEFAAFWFSDPDVGIDLGVDSASLAVAIADYDAAELDEAVEYVVGGNRQQSTVRTLANEAASMRGMRIWRDYDTGDYKFQVDKLPRLTNLLRLGHGGNVFNLLAPPRESPTSLFSAVQTLKVRYGAGGRTIGGGNFQPQDFAYANTANAQPVGKLATVDLRLTRTHETAARIAYYWAKSLEHSDGRISMVAGREAWRVRIGDVVQAVVDQWGVDEPYRALSITTSLDKFDLALAGPFDAEIFSTDLGDINAVVQQPTGAGNPDERPPDGVSGNMILNSDFSTGQRAVALASSSPDSAFLPGWTFLGTGGWFTHAAVEREPLSVGGYVLRLTTDNSAVPGSPKHFLQTGYPDGSGSGIDAGRPVSAGHIYLPSIHLTHDAADAVDSSFVFLVWWFASDGSVVGGFPVETPVRIMPGAMPHPQGWRRYYTLVRAPATAAGALLEFGFLLGETEYQLDAPALEPLSRLNRLPTPWQRNAAFGLHPAQMRSGDLLIRAPGQTQVGIEIAGDPFDVELDSGTEVTLCTVQPGDVQLVVGYVAEEITGVGGWKLQLDGVDLYTGMGMTELSNITGAHRVFTPPHPLLSAKLLKAVATSGTFTAGRVVGAAHRLSGTTS